MEFEDFNYLFEITKTEIEPGTVIAHTDMGDGDPIIFIHGLGSYISAWNKNLSTLSQHFRCLAIDLPGYGKSSKILHSGTMEYYSSVVIKLMDKLGINRANICGHSMGGVIALKLAIEYPERLKNLVLIAPGGAETYTQDEKILVQSYLNTKKIIANDKQQIANNVIVNFYNFPDDAQFMIDDRIALRSSSDFHTHATIVARSAAGVVNSDVSHRLNEIKAPVFALFADHDKLIPNKFLHPDITHRDIINTFESGISDIRIFELKNCGHFIQFEQPEAFNDLIITSLTKNVS